MTSQGTSLIVLLCAGCLLCSCATPDLSYYEENGYLPPFCLPPIALCSLHHVHHCCTGSPPGDNGDEVGCDIVGDKSVLPYYSQQFSPDYYTPSTLLELCPNTDPDYYLCDGVITSDDDCCPNGCIRKYIISSFSHF